MLRYDLIGNNSDDIYNIFKNRGVNPDSVMKLNESALYDPFLMKNMKEAVELIHHYIENDDRLIAIQQDPDADGLTSTALTFMYLTDCYPELKERLRIFIQPGKAHGIQVNVLKDLIDKGEEFCLVIAPDCSSNEEDVHKEIKDLGIEVVVLDHHDADKYSEYATMVNISLDDYPNKNLSGVGVCQKFAKAYDNTYGFDFADKYYDLVAVGLVGDMIELNTPEAMYMVQKGMKDVRTAFMKSVYKMKSYNIGDQITPTGIAFYVVPLLNAAVRVGTIEEKQMLTEAMCTKVHKEVPSKKRGAKKGDTEIIQEQAIRILGNIKSRQGREVDKAMEKLNAQIAENNLEQNQLILLDTKGEFPSEFNGLIANKFLQKYKKPVLIGREHTFDGQLVFSGSARGDDKSTLPNLKTFLNESGKVIYAEGHEAAHGFAIPAGTQQELVDYFNTKLAGQVFEPVYKLDFIINYSDVSIDNMLEITRYATFWARGLEEPVFLLKDVPVFKGDIETSGSFDSQLVRFKSGPLQFVSFGVPMDKAVALKQNQRTTIDVIGKVVMNTYNGESNLQIIVEDFDIKETQQYYF